MKPRSVAISVEGYIGLPGAGKTYALALRGIEAMRQGRRVFSNFGLRGTIPLTAWDHDNVGNTKDPGPPCECGECFVSISHAVVLVDEINLWAPSRMWNALPMGLLHRWAQVRKYETQILWSAQHEARVDKVIREVTGFIWECKATVAGQLFHWLPGISTFRMKAFEPHDLRKQGAQPLHSRGLRLKRGIAEAYDTFELVAMGSQFELQTKKSEIRTALPVRDPRPISEQLTGSLPDDEMTVEHVLAPVNGKGSLPSDPWATAPEWKDERGSSDRHDSDRRQAE